jgi:hypothetical protein
MKLTTAVFLPDIHNQEKSSGNGNLLTIAKC